MFEDMMVQHCSPTLAGIKTGNMFRCAFADERAMQDSLWRYNQRLCGKGVRVLPLHSRQGHTLIYVYRPRRLTRDLAREGAVRLLRARGYTMESDEHCIMQLRQRLQEQEWFPHEIGLFLGYPPEDVCGFIHNSAAYTCVGHWKVYGDAETAQKLFRQYRQCTAIYCTQLAYGRPLERLTVAI